MKKLTNVKYIKNQQSFIKRERKFIFRDHFQISSVLLILIAIIIFITAGFAPPDQWKDTTITLKGYQTVHTGKGGTRLDIYDTNGVRYAINRNENHIKAKLVVGRQYTFTYSDNFFHDIVEVMDIDGIEFLDYDSAMENYRGMKIMFQVILGILFVVLILLNLFIYKTGSIDRVKRIQKYQNRIHDRKNRSE